MVSYSSSLHLLASHLWLGAIAAILFTAGAGTAAPVVRSDVRWLMAVPLWVVRQVLRVIGPAFPPIRVFTLIFTFNSVAIFLYMVSGVLIVLPAAIAFLTGLNIGVVVLKAGEIELPSGERPLAATLSPRDDRPVAPWVSLCSLAVLVLELPSFWISLGMGIGLGRALSQPGHYTLSDLAALVGERAWAYLTIVVPVLFLSALAETAAIRGQVNAGPRERRKPPEDE